jgi:adenylate cyclase
MLRLRLGRSGAFGLGLGAAGVALSLLPPLLEVDEALGLGALFALRGAAVPPADVVVISISRDSAAGVGQTSELDEWPRTLHADLIDRLSTEGAAIVAFDVIFDEPRVPEDDRRLGEAVQRAGNVILLERTESDTLTVDGPSAVVHGVIERRVPPIAVLKAGALASAPFALPVVPVRVGQFWTFGRAAGDVPSLPVAALQAYLLPYYEDFVALLLSVRPELARALPATRASVTAGKNLESLMRSIRGAVQRDPTLLPALRAHLAQPSVSPSVLAALSVLVDLYGGRDSRYLNYYGPARTLRTIPYDRVLNGGGLDLAGKMVFVGFSESRQPEQQDSFYSVFSQRSGANLSGVEIGATAFANLLGQTALVPLGMPVHLLLVLVWGALFGTWLAWLSTSRAFAVAVLAAGAYFAIVYWQFAAQSLWLPLIVPLGIQLPLALGVAVFLNYRQLVAQRTRVQTALGYYVPSELAQRLAEQSVHAGANRQLLHGTCLFTDAQEYTTVSEALRPDELAALMNDYYGVMFEVVTRHGGSISDTAGDSMVATWASAQPDAALRTRACRAAIERCVRTLYTGEQRYHSHRARR